MDLDVTQIIDLGSDIEEEGEEDNNRKVGELKVFRYKGGDECIYPIFPGKNVIGRDQRCDICIPVKPISKKHACIETSMGQFLIYDFGSRNKTRKNKMILQAAVRYEIKDSDEISFADVRCQFKEAIHEQDNTVSISGSETESESMLSEKLPEENVSFEDDQPTYDQSTFCEGVQLLPTQNYLDLGNVDVCVKHNDFLPGTEEKKAENCTFAADTDSDTDIEDKDVNCRAHTPETDDESLFIIKQTPGCALKGKEKIAVIESDCDSIPGTIKSCSLKDDDDTLQLNSTIECTPGSEKIAEEQLQSTVPQYSVADDHTTLKADQDTGTVLLSTEIILESDDENADLSKVDIAMLSPAVVKQKEGYGSSNTRNDSLRKVVTKRNVEKDSKKPLHFATEGGDVGDSKDGSSVSNDALMEVTDNAGLKSNYDIYNMDATQIYGIDDSDMEDQAASKAHSLEGDHVEPTNKEDGTHSCSFPTLALPDTLSVEETFDEIKTDDPNRVSTQGLADFNNSANGNGLIDIHKCASLKNLQSECYTGATETNDFGRMDGDFGSKESDTYEGREEDLCKISDKLKHGTKECGAQNPISTKENFQEQDDQISNSVVKVVCCDKQAETEQCKLGNTNVDGIVKRRASGEAHTSKDVENLNALNSAECLASEDQEATQVYGDEFDGNNNEFEITGSDTEEKIAETVVFSKEALSDSHSDTNCKNLSVDADDMDATQAYSLEEEDLDPPELISANNKCSTSIYQLERPGTSTGLKVQEENQSSHIVEAGKIVETGFKEKEGTLATNLKENESIECFFMPSASKDNEENVGVKIAETENSKEYEVEETQVYLEGKSMRDNNFEHDDVLIGGIEETEATQAYTFEEDEAAFTESTLINEHSSNTQDQAVKSENCGSRDLTLEESPAYSEVLCTGGKYIEEAKMDLCVSVQDDEKLNEAKYSVICDDPGDSTQAYSLDSLGPAEVDMPNDRTGNSTSAVAVDSSRRFLRGSRYVTMIKSNERTEEVTKADKNSMAAAQNKEEGEETDNNHKADGILESKKIDDTDGESDIQGNNSTDDGIDGPVNAEDEETTCVKNKSKTGAKKGKRAQRSKTRKPARNTDIQMEPGSDAKTKEELHDVTSYRKGKQRLDEIVDGNNTNVTCDPSDGGRYFNENSTNTSSRTQRRGRTSDVENMETRKSKEKVNIINENTLNDGKSHNKMEALDRNELRCPTSATTHLKEGRVKTSSSGSTIDIPEINIGLPSIVSAKVENNRRSTRKGGLRKPTSAVDSVHDQETPPTEKQPGDDCCTQVQKSMSKRTKSSPHSECIDSAATKCENDMENKEIERSYFDKTRPGEGASKVVENTNENYKEIDIDKDKKMQRRTRRRGQNESTILPAGETKDQPRIHPSGETISKLANTYDEKSKVHDEKNQHSQTIDDTDNTKVLRRTRNQRLSKHISSSEVERSDFGKTYPVEVASEVVENANKNYKEIDIDKEKGSPKRTRRRGQKESTILPAGETKDQPKIHASGETISKLANTNDENSKVYDEKNQHSQTIDDTEKTKVLRRTRSRGLSKHTSSSVDPTNVKNAGPHGGDISFNEENRFENKTDVNETDPRPQQTIKSPTMKTPVYRKTRSQAEGKELLEQASDFKEEVGRKSRRSKRRATAEAELIVPDTKIAKKQGEVCLLMKKMEMDNRNVTICTSSTAEDTQNEGISKEKASIHAIKSPVKCSKENDFTDNSNPREPQTNETVNQTPLNQVGTRKRGRLSSKLHTDNIGEEMSPKPTSKKLKQDNSSPRIAKKDDDQGSVRSLSRSPSLPRSPSLRGGHHAPKVLFTGLTDQHVEKVAKDLGAELVSTVYEATHLVTDKVRRTVKFLCCLCRGLPIVDMAWLNSCKQAGTFLPASKYIINDRAAEKQYQFSLKRSIDKAVENPLLAGYEVYVCKNVKPDPKQMKDIIQCARGKTLTRFPVTDTEKILIIADEGDVKEIAEAKKMGLAVYRAELLLTGILQQELKFKEHELVTSTATSMEKTRRKRK